MVIQVFLQGLSLFPLAYFGYYGEIPTFLLFLSVALYFSFGMAAGAAWNPWISTLIPPERRVHFFSFRNLVMYSSLLCGMLLARVLLKNYFSLLGPEALFSLKMAFFYIYLIAGSCRLLSALGLLFHPKAIENHIDKKIMIWGHLKFIISVFPRPLPI